MKTLARVRESRAETLRPTHAHKTVVVEERGVTSAQIQEPIIDMLLPLVVEEQCCREEDLRGAPKGSTSRSRCFSRSTQQVLDVGAPFMLEQRFQLITWEAEPLILKMTAEAVQPVPFMEVCLCLRQLKEAVEEHGATASIHHAQVI